MKKSLTIRWRLFRGTPKRSLLVSFALTASMVGAPAHAQDKAGEIDEIFGWATPDCPGCAVAVSLNGKVVVNRAYGSADLERGVPISTSTLFDAGSVVKQFVAASVLLLVEEGRLSLSDDIREHFPELPDYGRTVTVDHLLTHTSGIRDWTGLLMLSSEDEDALTAILRQRGLNFPPGEEWSYSNSGYVLLKELVARTTGMPFSEFARSRLFEPLGMTTTRYADELREGIENLALAYEKDGDGWKQDMLVGNARGGGALLSTAGDLVIWNEALTNARLGAFVTEKIQEPARLNNGRELGYARGLFLDANRGGRVVWHSGGAAGYGSLVSRYPEQGLSIAIVCNAGESAKETLYARRIYDLFVPATDAPGDEAEAPAELAGDPDAGGFDLSGKAGLFFSEGAAEPLRLIVRGGGLRVAAGPPLEPVAKDRFRNPEGTLSFMSDDKFEVHFLSPDEFVMTSMEGKTTRYRRAQPYAPTAADLQAFAGRYENDEIASVFRIEPKGDGLRMSLEHAPGRSLEFRPIAPDTFQFSRMTVRFRRDEAGKVVALDYSNPVLRNVIFTRLSDGPSGR